jgi:hypothetical protein
MPITIDMFGANSDLAERLDWACEFRIGPHALDPSFSIDDHESFEVFAHDASGGLFLTLPGRPSIAYVSSEGQAGTIAADFDAFFALLVTCPYWRDVLKFSGNGDIGEMRRAAAALRAICDDEEIEEIEDIRTVLKYTFDISAAADPVGALHRAVSACDLSVRTPDGSLYQALFNTLTVDQSPMLRDALS